MPVVIKEARLRVPKSPKHVVYARLVPTVNQKIFQMATLYLTKDMHLLAEFEEDGVFTRTLVFLVPFQVAKPE